MRPGQWGPGLTLRGGGDETPYDARPNPDAINRVHLPTVDLHLRNLDAIVGAGNPA